MKGFFLLMSFMTRLYVPKVEYDEIKLGKAMKLFPIAGFIIGLFLYFTAFLFFRFTYSINLAIIFVILVEIILTGGIHLDGLADTFDGIFSYRSKQKMLEIMKDSRIGTNGVLALIMYFLLKFFLLQTIAQILGLEYFLYVVFSYPIVARLCSVVSCASAPYARASGMGKTFIENTNFSSIMISFFLTLVLTQLPLLLQNFSLNLYFIMFISFIIIFIIMMLISYLFSKLMTKKIGGITGDTLGALLELSQLLYMLLIIFSVIKTRF